MDINKKSHPDNIEDLLAFSKNLKEKRDSDNRTTPKTDSSNSKMPQDDINPEIIIEKLQNIIQKQQSDEIAIKKIFPDSYPEEYVVKENNYSLKPEVEKPFSSLSVDGDDMSKNRDIDLDKINEQINSLDEQISIITADDNFEDDISSKFSGFYSFVKKLLFYILIIALFILLIFIGYSIGSVKNVDNDILGANLSISADSDINDDYHLMGGVPIPDFGESEEFVSPDNSENETLSNGEFNISSESNAVSESNKNPNISNSSSQNNSRPSQSGNPPGETLPPNNSLLSSDNNLSDNNLSDNNSSVDNSVSDNNDGVSPVGTVSVNVNGSVQKMNAIDAVAGWVATEISYSYPEEAIKAQAVAAYTYIKYYNARNSSPAIYIKTPHKKILNAVKEVAGIAIYYGDSFAFTPWHAMSAGVTLSSVDVWGGFVPNLQSTDSSIEIGYNNDSYSKFETSVNYAASSVRQVIESKMGITLSNNPENWFKINSYIKTLAYNGRQIGYVNEVSIDSQATKSGRYIRENILNGIDGVRFRSAAFDEPIYDSATDTFIFTTYGYGHGCGMSQTGMRLYAQKEGWSYDKILNHYYQDVVIK